MKVFVFHVSIYHIPRAGFIVIGRECSREHPESGRCGHLRFKTQGCMFLQLLAYQLSGDDRLYFILAERQRGGTILSGHGNDSFPCSGHLRGLTGLRKGQLAVQDGPSA